MYFGFTGRPEGEAKAEGTESGTPQATAWPPGKGRAAL
jgi:hypothetical protein